MFTIQQIQEAHSQVKSGADFPAYIQAIKALGVTHYEAFVQDGHTDYFGGNDYGVQVPGKYVPLALSTTVHVEEFKAGLLAHQQGQTDYPTFIQLCAKLGIAKWVVHIDRLTCTYFSIMGTPVLEEPIPG
jgi:uncharacterized protein YbcV (DUF1398 family)